MALEFGFALVVILGAAVLFTSWELGPLNLFSAALALLSGASFIWCSGGKGRCTPGTC